MTTSDFLFQQRLQLQAAGFEVVAAQGRSQAEELLTERRPDVAVFDVMMENPDAGFVLCHHIRKKDPSIPVILVTSVNSETGLDFGWPPKRTASGSRPTPCWPSRSASSSFIARSTGLRWPKESRTMIPRSNGEASRAMETLRVLVADDEMGMRLGVARTLRDFTVRVPDVNAEVEFRRRSGRIGRRGPGKNPPAAARHPALGPQDARHQRPGRARPDSPSMQADMLTIMITAYASIETAVSATKRGAYDFLAKPFTPDELKSTIRKTAARLILAKQARKLAEEKRQVRFEFIRVLGHELKAPLNAVAGYLELMQDRTLGEKLRPTTK